MQSQRHTFVLVHGAWHGGWCWRRVADLLTERGHKVYTPTLTGLGERSHLLSASINLDTHIADVVNVIRWENLSDVVLVGHSYAGWPISGAVEQVLPQIRSLVYLDAFVPENGQSGLDVASPSSRQAVLDAIARGDIARPSPPATAFGLSGEDAAWVAGKVTPQPVAVEQQPIVLTGARDKVAKKTFIRLTGFAHPSFQANYERLKNDPAWRTYLVEGGHDMMVDQAGRLAEILLESA